MRGNELPDNHWNALETFLKASSAPGAPFLSGCNLRANLRYLNPLHHEYGRLLSFTTLSSLFHQGHQSRHFYLFVRFDSNPECVKHAALNGSGPQCISPRSMGVVRQIPNPVLRLPIPIGTLWLSPIPYRLISFPMPYTRSGGSSHLGRCLLGIATRSIRTLPYLLLPNGKFPLLPSC